MICLSSSIKGIIHYESVPPKQTLNTAFYLPVFEHLQQNINWKSQVFGQKSEFCFMTMHHCIQTFQYRDFLPKNKYQCWNIHCIQLMWPHVNFLYFNHSEQCDSTARSSGKLFLAMFSGMAEKMEWVYKSESTLKVTTLTKG